MEMNFSPMMQKKWTLTDDSVVVGKREIKLASLLGVSHSPLKNGKSTLAQQNGSITLTYGKGAFDFVIVAYSGKQNEEGEKAAKYIMDFVYSEENQNRRREISEKGIRKRCNVCGKIFCYTLEDLEKNKRNAQNALLSGLGGVAGALSGNYAASAVNNQTADNSLNRIVDYNKCPECGSRDLSDATDEDIAQANAPQPAAVNAVSSADELKKFKELLDAGIITQEEFDAKKKQLLGL